MTEIHNAFMGRQIRKAREQQGLTQKALGDAIGRTESSIAKYEQGQVEIPLSIIHRLADALHVEFNYILGAEKHSPFVLADLEDRLKQIGYSIGCNEEGPDIWINYPNGGQLEVTLQDVETLIEKSNDYMRFLLNDLRERLQHDKLEREMRYHEMRGNRPREEGE